MTACSSGWRLTSELTFACQTGSLAEFAIMVECQAAGMEKHHYQAGLFNPVWQLTQLLGPEKSAVLKSEKEAWAG